MNHDEAVPLLDPYLDEELDIVSARAVDHHVNSCDTCARWLAERRRLARRLRSASLRYDLPPEAAHRLRRIAHPDSPPQTRLTRWPAALAAGLLLTLSGFFYGHSVLRSTELRDELVTAHIRAVLSRHPVDVESSDHHTVKPWLSTQLPFSPPVPELGGLGDVLVGGRVDYLEHTRVAALLYQHSHHSVNVFLWPSSILEVPTSSGTTTGGFNVVVTRVGEFTAAIVSDMSTNELRRFRDQWSQLAMIPP